MLCCFIRFLLQIINGQASLVHLVFSVAFSVHYVFMEYAICACQIYVNDVATPSVAFISSTSLVPSLWSKDDRAIFLPSTSGQSSVDLWAGKIFYFSMYDKVCLFIVCFVAKYVLSRW